MFQWLAAGQWFSAGNSGFLHQENWPSWYNWNSVWSGVKPNNPNRFQEETQSTILDSVRQYYDTELEVKETTDTASSASFLDLYLEFDDSGQLSTKIYDKRDDFNFKIINFPNMCSNIPASPAYGAYISQLIRYSRVSSNYSDFLKRHLHLRKRLLDQAMQKFALFDFLKSLYSIPRSSRNIFRLCRSGTKRCIFK